MKKTYLIYRTLWTCVKSPMTEYIVCKCPLYTRIKWELHGTIAKAHTLEQPTTQSERSLQARNIPQYPVIQVFTIVESTRSSGSDPYDSGGGAEQAEEAYNGEDDLEG